MLLGPALFNELIGSSMKKQVIYFSAIKKTQNCKSLLIKEYDLTLIINLNLKSIKHQLRYEPSAEPLGITCKPSGGSMKNRWE